MEEIGIRIVGEDHNPQEYEGLIFNMPAEDIPIRLAREIARVGSMELWQFQAFEHHEHPFMGSDDTYAAEMLLVEDWREMLAQRFPKHRFVIEVDPDYLVTWYQATKNAPTEDDGEWDEYQPPITFTKEDFSSVLKHMKDGLEAFNQARKEDFNRRTPRKGSLGSCEKCGSSAGFSEPTISTDHRGVRFMNCLECQAELVHSTKTIRFVVGPEPCTIDE